MSPRRAGPQTKSTVPASLDPAAPADERGASTPGPTDPARNSAEPVAPNPPPAPTVQFRVSRWKKGDREPRFEEFEVEIDPGATVLDGLMEIRRCHDPSLVFRHSCLHAACGTCGVRIDGREALACDTSISDLASQKRVRVEPLADQRPVADLATDMVDFYARFDAVGLPGVRAAEAAGAAQPPENVKAFGRFENCIECGLCLSACPIARANRDYIGPAALAAAARLVKEPRGRDLGPVLELASEPDSVWRCRDILECTAVCPSAVDPAGALLGLRRSIAATGLRRLIRRVQ